MEKSVIYQEILAEGLQKGRQKGRQEGIEIGVQQGGVEAKAVIAKNMLSIGISIEQVAVATGLSQEEIEAF